MLAKVILLLLGLAFIAFVCSAVMPMLNGPSAPANIKTVGDAVKDCFPPPGGEKYLNYASSISSYFSRDDFEGVSSIVESQVSCSADTAFLLTYNLYKDASAKMNHPAMEQSTAWIQFKSHWR